MLDLTQAYLRDFAAGIPSEPQVPYLIAVGEHEVGMLRTAAACWHANTRSSRLEIIPGAGHIANHDQADAFNLVLTSFLQELAADETVATATSEPVVLPAWPAAARAFVAPGGPVSISRLRPTGRRPRYLEASSAARTTRSVSACSFARR